MTVPSTKGSSKNAGFVSCPVLENIDGSPESIILESVLEGMSEYYSRNLAKREVQKGKKETAYKCLHSGGVPPIGYQVDGSGKYHVDPIESKMDHQGI